EGPDHGAAAGGVGDGTVSPNEVKPATRGSGFVPHCAGCGASHIPRHNAYRGGESTDWVSCASTTFVGGFPVWPTRRPDRCIHCLSHSIVGHTPWVWSVRDSRPEWIAAAGTSIRGHDHDDRFSTR